MYIIYVKCLGYLAVVKLSSQKYEQEAIYEMKRKGKSFK